MKWKRSAAFGWWKKHELEDNLPRIYRNAIGAEYPGRKLNDGTVFGAQEMQLLRELCGENRNQYEMVRELLAIESRHKPAMRRTRIFQSLQSAIERNFYSGKEDAVDRARDRVRLLTTVTERQKTDVEIDDS